MKQSAAFKGSYLNIISKIWREETQVISAIFSSRRIGSVALGEGEPPILTNLGAPHAAGGPTERNVLHITPAGEPGGGHRTDSTAIPEGRSGRNNSPSPKTTAREIRYATELPVFDGERRERISVPHRNCPQCEGFWPDSLLRDWTAVERQARFVEV